MARINYGSEDVFKPKNKIGKNYCPVCCDKWITESKLVNTSRMFGLIKGVKVVETERRMNRDEYPDGYDDGRQIYCGKCHIATSFRFLGRD